jgi:LysR family transcriptional regulator, glycine cleavage system transcriptional activator
MRRTRQRLPPFRALQAFHAIAQSGSVSRAAAELQVSSGAVSQQIRLLERHLGLPLIERSGRGVALTSLGRNYHRQIAVVFEMLLRAQESIERTSKATNVTISALPSLVTTWLTPCLFEFLEQHPAAALRLIGSEDEPGEDTEVDFRLSYGHRVRGYGRFIELFVDRVVPVCAPSFAKTAALGTPANLLSLPLIHIEWDRDFTPAPTWADWFQSVGLTVSAALPGLSFSLSSAAIAAAVSGRGLALAQLSMIEADLKAGHLIKPFEASVPLAEPYFVAWNAAALAKIHGPLLLSWLIAAGRSKDAVHA